ncbi:hypothetical protein A5886_001426 [Enterococcus sp. 8G7_MSG3316]|uniref:Uncharacterized protein n=1 Tax=Candidatus Enterococcus testudinis TaxID=1834191 RepID=A0A242A607_9ENTE|nr:sigma 54-interacting transcriptional regulator [Enterococcus sp. 8G7_MSG3316]OTN76349.1 hypothetical protein A5886_001426 [Enterococcus sp. 8G7_MSG3316]
MRRIDTIYLFCEKETDKINRSDLIANPDIGITTSYISEKLGIMRNNVSSDLNSLVKDGKLIKIKGKPTRFLCNKSLEKMLSIPFIQLQTISSTFEIIDLAKHNSSEDPFETLIGANKSLAPVIQLAEAAINYPPRGLHTIILGESGTGKSLLAEKMHEHGKKEDVFAHNSQFVILNCADYSTNPQLLLGQLFGSKKGAYTGADIDKKGLIEIADKGVLFLDEVHRLPPEGQEMLFQYIDKGSYYKLGETHTKTFASTLLILATTEHPNSVLLDTFKRRIPVAIQMPNLNNRDFAERLELILHLYDNESKKINSCIVVEGRAISSLLTYTPVGNIGQLKSDIQLSVARGLLEKKKNHLDKVSVTQDFFPPSVASSFISTTAKEKQIVSTLVDQDYFEFGTDLSINEPTDGDYDFLDFFQEKKEGYSITKAFEDYSQKIAKQRLMNEHFSFLLNEDIKKIMLTVSDVLYEECGIIINDNISTAFALYIYSRTNDTNTPSIDLSPKNSDVNITNALRRITRELENLFDLYFSEDDIVILSNIISSIKNNEKQTSDFGILVCAHGDRVASELSQTINQLLGTDVVLPIDMPLNAAPKEIYEKIKILVDELEYANFLLFVDMGSMAGIEGKIREETGKNLFIIERIDTLILLETAKNKALLSMDLPLAALSILDIEKKRAYSVQQKINQYFGIKKRKVIYTVCRTGEGTAKFLETNLKNSFQNFGIYDVDIKPVNGNDARSINDFIDNHKDYEVIATVGTLDPKITFIPFISLQEIILKDGLSKLLTLAGRKTAFIDSSPADLYTRDIVIDMGIESVDKYLYLSLIHISFTHKFIN